MAKKRFRDVKQKKSATDRIQHTPKDTQPKYPYASLADKMKAFLTDSFMLLMPLLYIVFYLVMGSREVFAENMLAGWIYILVPLIALQTAFLQLKGQTPGYRAYNLTLIDEATGGKPTLYLILFRNFCALLSLFTIIGWVMMFFRKDRKTLHDLLSRTAVIEKK